MWEIRGIITMCLSVCKNQTWKGTAQHSRDHSAGKKQDIEEVYLF